jgi:hypothetical protein
MSGVLCAQTGGYPNFLGSATVTVGNYFLTGTGSTVDFWGVVGIGANPGSISPATWADSGFVVDDFDYRVVTFTSPYSVTYALVFGVVGYAPNAGWTTVTIDGNAYNRADASYSYNGTNTVWAWSTTSTNPYGTTVGATKAVTWS